MIGVQERELHGTSIYNTTLYFSPEGELMQHHRKLVPTGAERTVWSPGDGSTLAVVQAGEARIGGLTCWENYMPLARFYLYSQGVEVWLAPTLAAGDAWISTMQHIACENRMFVIGVNPVPTWTRSPRNSQAATNSSPPISRGTANGRTRGIP